MQYSATPIAKYSFRNQLLNLMPGVQDYTVHFYTPLHIALHYDTSLFHSLAVHQHTVVFPNSYPVL